MTTSLELPDALQASIAQAAAFEGKTLRALMVETLQIAMEDAQARRLPYAGCACGRPSANAHR